ncbi:MAG: hypothetical protein JSV05_10090 [Candidatus Bathyarchaeota archaeon]|nr:MAG: hypothetical protein JSV05_10090 [Candidatus Bathyarchaeota archaeon]
MLNKIDKLIRAINTLVPEKRIAASKWLEGVIAGQGLTTEERETIVKTVNEYIRDLKEDQYEKGINALLDFLRDAQIQHKIGSTEALRSTI